MKTISEIMSALQIPLTRDEIDFRAAELRGQYISILAYKDARCDMKRLDEATGGLWQNDYKRDSQGILQCGIGIKLGEEWVWKWSNGTESNFEKEKGEYSDAFKRAGFMWGIGRELYAYPKLYTKIEDDELKGEKVNYNFKPNDWEWLIARDEKGITHISAYDTKHKKNRFSYSVN